MARGRLARWPLRGDPDRRGALISISTANTNLAEALEFAAPPRLADSQDGGVNPSKGDRLLRPVDIVSDKQTFKAPTIIKVGDQGSGEGATFTHPETTLTMT